VKHSDSAVTGAPRRAWPWVLLGFVMLFGAALVAGAVALADFFEAAARGFDLRIDGERVLTVPEGEASLALLLALVAAALVVAVMVPLAIAVAPLAIAVALALVALGMLVATAAVLAVAAVLLSPLWVPLVLLALALREPRRAGAATARTAARVATQAASPQA
jgi:hypothetical protein